MRKYYIVTGMLLMMVFMRAGAQGLHLMPGTHLVASGAPQLVLNDAGLINDGAVTADSSSCWLSGNGSFVGGSHPIAFYHLIIGGDVQLRNHVFAGGGVFMQGGNLQLNRYTLDLGRKGYIVYERNEACISGGLIKATALLDAPHEVNPGNIGLSFTSDANLGWTTVVRGNEPQTEAGIRRWFNIQPEREPGVPVTYRLFYFEGELAGVNRERLAVFSKANVPGGWVSWGKDEADLVKGWVSKRGFAGVHFVTLGIPFNGPQQMVVAPNPSSGQFRVIWVSEKEGDKLMRLYDALGHLVASRWVHCLAGSNSIEWNGGGLGQGVYRLAAEGMDPLTVEIIR